VGFKQTPVGFFFARFMCTQELLGLVFEAFETAVF
jgi:hypothetical protein